LRLKSEHSEAQFTSSRLKSEVPEILLLEISGFLKTVGLPAQARNQRQQTAAPASASAEAKTKVAVAPSEIQA